MINIEPQWIAEVVQVSLIDYLVLEMFNKDYNLAKSPFISTYDKASEIVYCVFRYYQDSIDDSRKAIALNMSDKELSEEHPEHSFLIKPYFNASLIGSIHDSKFTSGVQVFNVGLHTRFNVTSTKTIINLFNNPNNLDSLLLIFLTNQLLKPQLKSVCTLLMHNNNSAETKAMLLSHLSRLLRDDYFFLKEISCYIQ